MQGETGDLHRAPTRLGSAILILLGVIIVSSTIVYGAVDPGAFAILSMIIGAIVVMWTIDAWRRNEFALRGEALLLPLAALAVIGVIQLLPLSAPNIQEGVLRVQPVFAISLDAYSTRLFLTRLVIYLIFFAAALRFIDSRSRLLKIVLTVIIFGSVMAFFGILQYLSKPGAIYGLRPTPQAIPFGPFVNQHHFAALMEMTAGLALGLLVSSRTKREHRLFLLIAVLLMGIALVLTSSRGGLLSFLALISFLATANFLPGAGTRKPGDRKSLKRPLVLAAAGVGLIFLIFGGVLFLGGDQSLIRGVGLESGQADVTSGRAHFWAVAVKVFLAHPIIGAGLDAFGVAFTRYDTQNGLFRVEQAHNDYLQTLADAGVVGILCIASFIYFLFKKSLAIVSKHTDGYRRDVALGALAGCFGILVHSFFDFPLRTPANAFFFLTLAALATVDLSAATREHERTLTAGD